MKGKPRNPNKV